MGTPEIPQNDLGSGTQMPKRNLSKGNESIGNSVIRSRERSEARLTCVIQQFFPLFGLSLKTKQIKNKNITVCP